MSRAPKAAVEEIRGLVRAAARAFIPAVPPTRTPLVSVVIATYNWSSVLRHAIASALAQSYPSFEVVVVGDGCTDDTEEVVASFGDRRVRWLPLAENSGSQSIPNNAGIAAARGEIVAYLGHDDLWLPDHLVRLVEALERTDAVIAAAVTLALGPPGSNVRILTGHRPFRPGQTWLPPSSIAHRASLVSEIGPWRDYRAIVLPPDREFVGRAAPGPGMVALTGALTVLKLNSAWRKDSYALRRDDEQRALAARLRRPRLTALRELAAYAWARVERAPLRLPSLDPAPEAMPPGWQVEQWRRIRGLEPRATAGNETAPGPVSVGGE